MKSRILRRFSALGIFSVLIGAPFTASTAQTLEEIVVTAAYREQGLQDVPVSISAVTGDTITSTAIQKAEDIQFLVPNFTLTETGIGTNAFVRGIDQDLPAGFRVTHPH